MGSHDVVEVDGPELQLPETVLVTHAEHRAEREPRALTGDSAAPPVPPASAVRYDERTLLGVGGMGEVRLCRDRVIGRDVAMKLIRDRERAAGDEASWRFLREARVQGQLEHPAIVPVYDLGADASGRMFFTMKRIRGASLADVIAKLGAGDPGATKRWTARRLLTYFTQLCTAMEYAHSRGVVHRDLKPANLMLGDFGEVYVLDWGLARLGRDHEPRFASIEGARASADDAGAILDSDSDGSTATGAILGTPGYMAPEQLREGLAAIGPRTDVYALGLVLYEILTLERVRADLSLAQRIVRTLEDDGLSPAAAAPHRAIPPELDRLCHDATRLRPADRVASARELAERVEAFLDGDRDAVLRASMAERHAQNARAALARSTDPSADEAEERATAMREVTLALGLAPEHEDARRTLVTLLASPPRTVPIEAERRAKQRFQTQRRLLGWGAIAHYFLVWLWVPLTFWMGVRDWTAFWTLGASIASCATLTGIFLWRRVERDERLPLAHVTLTSATVMFASQFLGPLVFVPVLALANQLAYVSIYSHRRWFVIAASVLSIVAPIVASWLGWIPPFYDAADGTLRILPSTLSLPYLPTVMFLLLTQTACLVVAGVLLGLQRDAYERAVTAVELQGWQLEQILPRAAVR